ncbi:MULTISPECIES: Ger(x)C family spore germination protein [Priestia]|uniref:Ger(X)C family spore germination protein n=1 Tax=Priestia megaterium TaxID=1404 RepID=A0ABD4WT66_PRIMG|nr:Ger(x)C family spore germination protein [Priestia megaterium]KRF53497.1 spore gernimation protein GerC [Bacillus sp. Soil531]MCF6795464.1 Ger(x)C family spore germination protein [Bacillus sp. ET1]MBD8846204.1 Ger(x)C family spore germination protein [Priestia megaterium]MDD9783335.1 Ger(x)C family spore germination protein [Priestia megaterium]MDN4861636.1 Ger(x)C family spore germination protein [Priestia megaterium]
MNLFLSRNVIKTLTILLFFLASFLLSGCWDRREVNDTALVLGAAIDKEKGGGIRLTVQILIPKAVNGQQQGGGASGTGSESLVRSAIGENIADAMSKVQTKIPRKIFWGHCKAYIIGEKFARNGGIHKQIDYLLRHPEPRERAHLFVSYGEAADVLALQPPLESYEGEVLRKLSEMKIGMDVTVKDFEQMLTGDSGVALLPLIKKLPPFLGGKPQETIAYIMGTAIFKKDKMIGQVDIKATRGLLWLRNEIEVTSVTVNPKKGESISLDPIRQTTKLIPTLKNGKWKILARITSEGTIVQNGSDLDVMSPQITKRVEKDVEKDIKKRINQSLKQVKKGMNVDAFGFADAFHRKYPKEWSKVKDHWDTVLPDVEVKIDIKTRVRRPGLSTTPAGLKEKEVEKK